MLFAHFHLTVLSGFMAPPHQPAFLAIRIVVCIKVPVILFRCHKSGKYGSVSILVISWAEGYKLTTFMLKALLARLPVAIAVVCQSGCFVV